MLKQIYRYFGFVDFTLRKIEPFKMKFILVFGKLFQKFFKIQLHNIEFVMNINGVKTNITVDDIEQYTYLFKLFYYELFRVTYMQTKSPVILDGGANIGMTSLYYINKFPTAQIYAFEPSKRNVSLCKTNLINAPNFKIDQKALWDKSEILEFKLSNCSRYHSAFHRSESTYIEEVKAVRLDDWLKENCLKKIDILKLNVEGAELKAIRGLGEMIRNVSVIVGEFHPEFVDKQELIDELQKNKFKIIRFEKTGKTVSIFEAYNQKIVEKDRF